jgi:hypothetical protein
MNTLAVVLLVSGFLSGVGLTVFLIGVMVYFYGE